MISLKMMMMMMMMMKMMMKMFRFSSLSLDRSRRRSAKDLSLGDTHPPIGEKKRFQFYDDESCCSSKRRRRARRRTRGGRPFGGSGGVPSRSFLLSLVEYFLWGKKERVVLGKNEGKNGKKKDT